MCRSIAAAAGLSSYARHKVNLRVQELADALSSPSADHVTPLLPGNREEQRPPTMVFAPHACLLHRTALEPIVRGADVPPENVNRLHVLTDPGT